MSSDARELRDTNEFATEAWLRRRFADGRTVTPIATGDGHLWRQTEALRPAAVLVPMVRREAGLTILFTLRTDHLYDHAGQISFPGGRTEERDASPAATALRETFEEIGLPQSRVEVLGSLPEYTTVTGCTLPGIGLGPPLALSLTHSGWRRHSVPLTFFSVPATTSAYPQYRGRTRHYYAMPFEKLTSGARRRDVDEPLLFLTASGLNERGRLSRRSA
jgi:8-oxo-dGTP pyrophosphatase MutT (NUDIX family)